jgi:hypothetical protein
MNVSEKMKLQQWASDMVDLQNSRLTIEQRCKIHDTTESAFFPWILMAIQ